MLLYLLQNTGIKLIDLSFTYGRDISGAEAALHCYKPSLGYLGFIKTRLDIVFTALINTDEKNFVNGVWYAFFNWRKGYWPMLRFVKKEKPDVVIVQGLGFAAQVLLLRLWLGTKPAIIAQHHGERPRTGMARLLQKMADKCINAYFFTALGNTSPWVERGIIASPHKCVEVLEASTFITKQDRRESRQMLGITGDTNILWVGRLEQNKDPITVLHGFEKYLAQNPQARLYMIYQENILLDELKAIIAKNEALRAAVLLVGLVEHEKLSRWYSAVDFYISGSHREGSGYALIEAMACGCIPVVTDIAPFRAITNNGECAVLYQKGDSDSLLNALVATENIDKPTFSAKVLLHFNQKLSFKAIADDTYAACVKLVNR